MMGLRQETVFLGRTLKDYLFLLPVKNYYSQLPNFCNGYLLLEDRNSRGLVTLYFPNSSPVNSYPDAEKFLEEAGI